jgi:hypothetical protein
MLWVSRMPYVLAREGYLPPHLARVWAAHATPATTIVPDSDAPIATSSAPPAITQSAASATAPTPRSAEPLVDAEPFGGDGPLDDTNLLGGSPATSIVASSAASATAPTPRSAEPLVDAEPLGSDGPPGDTDVLGGSPATSIIACCAVFTILVPLGFSSLVVLDVFFYMGALTLEMWALIRLRKSHPDRAGLFVIGGGRVALIAVVVAPIFTWMATFGLAVSNHGGAAANDGGAAALIISIVLALGAWPAYAFLRHRYGGPQIAP